MKTITKLALIATVDFGFTKMDGLLLPDERYAIAVPQLAEKFSFDKNQASRKLKSLLGKGFQFDKVTSELNPKPVNIIPLPLVAKIIKALTIQGNPIADAFLDAILEEGLERRFHRAFHKRVTEDEYNAKLRIRMERVLARYEYTDFIRDRYLELYERKPESEVYRSVTIKVNLCLFHCQHFFCDRDNMTPEQQKIITQFETFVAARAKNHPTEPPEQVIDTILGIF